ncbi:MAG: patatin-like phospholipase family protein, partial [Pseudomonadota bacterium]
MGVKTRSQQPQSENKIEEPQPLPPLSEEKPPPVIEKPDFMKQEVPRLGLILGGGGALSYAHIGVLQEFEKHKIPVSAIAGMEWGALVAGSYALSDKAHAVEWKLLKIPHGKFEKQGFFSTSKKSVSVFDFQKFLKSLFEKNRFSDTRIPFVCPYLNVKKEKSLLAQKGALASSVPACWSYP